MEDADATVAVADAPTIAGYCWRSLASLLMSGCKFWAKKQLYT